MSKEDRFVFRLVNVNIKNVEQKYGITNEVSLLTSVIPDNSTRIEDIDVGKKPLEVVSFLDESKRVHKCMVSLIDYSGKGVYKCFWDKHDIPSDVSPIGCPVRYVSSKTTKSYNSEISKEQYSISEPITEHRAQAINGKGMSIERNNYYETDGAFCSFNCCMAFIQDTENHKNPLYRHSEMLLLQMYNDLVKGENRSLSKPEEIIPAPHWRMLTDFGGNLSIEKFRDSFNRVQYYYHGIVCKSIGRLYEDQIKF